MTNNDYLFRGSVKELDPDLADLIRHETARQQEKLILIPSESTVPFAVRDALSSPFHNIYAEGYPLENSRAMSQPEILNYQARLAEYRRNADQRYYKGVEYANILEALARRRVAERFAGAGLSPDDLFVNVQPLSGAPANNAVYSALLNVGETVMGMDLIMGGHLTHGSPVNRSGINYNIVSYGIDPATERLDYDHMLALARKHKPRLIIGGFSSYPFAADWGAYREIADAVGAILLADVAHVAGLMAAGLYPNPVGIADVVSFTTHKTLNGPRGAVLITHRKDLSRKLDRAVFPGEQGGPHINAMAAMAVALRIAGTDQFHNLQRQTLANARRLAAKLTDRGFRLPCGGTDTHLLLLDCKSIIGPDGTTLSGDMAARILDLAGIVVNRQTIPGDTSALRPSGIRLGTTWVTQRGMGSPEIDALAGIIADVLDACLPFSLTGRIRPLPRAKIDFDALVSAGRRARQLSAGLGIDTDAASDGYPHFYAGELESVEATNLVARNSMTDGGGHDMPPLPTSRREGGDWSTSLEISIEGAAGDFLHVAATSDVAALKDGESQATRLLEKDGSVMAAGSVTRQTATQYRLNLAGRADRAVAWLRALSDGFVLFDDSDLPAKLPGPVAVNVLGDAEPLALADLAGYARKAYHIGIHGEKFLLAPPAADMESVGATNLVARNPKRGGGRHDMSPLQESQLEGGSAPLPKFIPEIAAADVLRETPLHSLHLDLGAKMAPFAGYDMPLWYKSVSDEHRAVRAQAGIFDVAHMGVFDVEGSGAERFLDQMTTNDVTRLKVGDSHYTYLLDVDGIPLDDLMIYRLADERFLAVVNASNNDKNWAWLNAVIAGDVMIDPSAPGRRIEGGDRFQLRDLRLRQWGAERRVDIALQGPMSRDCLLQLGGDPAALAAVKRLKWAGVTQATLGGFDLIVSRTGYTGERVAYELFVHPDRAAELFKALVGMGATPCGLAARDSLRTEAGLPLYGLELAGDLNMNPADAGFGAYVKLYKPFFIGKRAFVDYEAKRKTQVSRFRLDNRGARPAHYGDPIVNARGRVVGVVTSCNIDVDGYQLGQALMDRAFRKPGTALSVFAGAARAKSADFASLSLGARVKMPEPLTILSRFPKRK
ncbi:MAG: serine hydroxymethyltransferase [Chloroflexota bacterium]|nr:serine hydroxymethyltransferase [Chloroflexota bacterium]MDE2946571.1 serine hydroxymethyltransferase [Chloroflexota bacterium]